MANKDAAFGLKPVRYLNGAPYTGKAQVYCIPDTDTTNAYAIGDPVVLAGSADSNGIPTITLATAGSTNLVLGAIVSGAGAMAYGASYGVPAESPIVIPATKSRAYYVLVADDPNIIFEIQEDSVGGALSAADVGLNASLVAGANNGYISGWELDSSTKATTAALQLKILRLAQRQGNAIGTNAVWEVLINQHVFKPVVAGI